MEKNLSHPFEENSSFKIDNLDLNMRNMASAQMYQGIIDSNLRHYFSITKDPNLDVEHIYVTLTTLLGDISTLHDRFDEKKEQVHQIFTKNGILDAVTILHDLYNISLKSTELPSEAYSCRSESDVKDRIAINAHFFINFTS